MNKRDLAFRTYLTASTPLRWLLRGYFNHRNRAPVAGIFLHRVADDVPNPWSITNTQFDAMLTWLQLNVDIVSIDEAQRRIREGHAGRMSVFITFDDGYADNCLFAIPELLSRRLPFTYYVTTQNVLTGKPFPHDLKRNEPLAPNSVDEIRALNDAGVEIGAHTRTHPDMGTISRESELELEIRGSRDDLADWTGKEPRHFAFPFGLPENLNPRAIQYLYDTGFESYASAMGGYNFPIGDAFHLKRFHGDPVALRLQNWLSYDPRWIFHVSEFEYVPFQRKQLPVDEPATTTNS